MKQRKFKRQPQCPLHLLFMGSLSEPQSKVWSEAQGLEGEIENGTELVPQQLAKSADLCVCAADQHQSCHLSLCLLHPLAVVLHFESPAEEQGRL